MIGEHCVTKGFGLLTHCRAMSGLGKFCHTFDPIRWIKVLWNKVSGKKDKEDVSFCGVERKIHHCGIG
jgi:hypothetical protein